MLYSNSAPRRETLSVCPSAHTGQLLLCACVRTEDWPLLLYISDAAWSANTWEPHDEGSWTSILEERNGLYKETTMGMEAMRARKKHGGVLMSDKAGGDNDAQFYKKFTVDPSTRYVETAKIRPYTKPERLATFFGTDHGPLGRSQHSTEKITITEKELSAKAALMKELSAKVEESLSLPSPSPPPPSGNHEAGNGAQTVLPPRRLKTS